MQTLTLENLLKARAYWKIGVECGMDIQVDRIKVTGERPMTHGEYLVRKNCCGITASKEMYAYFSTADEVRQFVRECFPGDSENEVEARAHVDRKIADLTPKYDAWMAEPLAWEA